MHGAVSIHRGESCAAADARPLAGPPAATGVRLPIASAGSLTLCDAEADACMSSTGTAQNSAEQHSTASHCRPYSVSLYIAEAISTNLSHTPCSKPVLRGIRPAQHTIDKKSSRRIMDCSQLAPASHFLSFPCMRNKNGLHVTKRWGG